MSIPDGLNARDPQSGEAMHVPWTLSTALVSSIVSVAVGFSTPSSFGAVGKHGEYRACIAKYVHMMLRHDKTYQACTAVASSTSSETCHMVYQVLLASCQVPRCSPCPTIGLRDCIKHV